MIGVDLMIQKYIKKRIRGTEEGVTKRKHFLLDEGFRVESESDYRLKSSTGIRKLKEINMYKEVN